MKQIKEIEKSRLFQRLKRAEVNDTVARDSLVANAHAVAQQAEWISKQIVRYLPQYTLHDETHLYNVLSIMEELLPEETLQKLTLLECALCIMAAFTHDLGMALSEAERAKLLDEKADSEERWAFLRHRSERFGEEVRQIERLIKQATEESRRKAGLLEGHILADYLRRTHASDPKRVTGWLKAMKQETGNAALFRYGGFDFEHHLALIAISHNQEPHWLREQLNGHPPRHDAFRKLVGAGEHANLAFPGILLRLADYMDFDATRAPGILFHHFGIDDTISVKEWQKHMAITGWELEATDDSPRLVYEAPSCGHPVFEKTIRDFVREIEREAGRTQDELRLQRRLMGGEDGEYEVTIPARVEAHVEAKRVDAKPAYIYQDWQFRLDQDEIQQLLMGETLYGDPSLAIRELLQNALDALQMRDLRLQLLWDEPTAAVEPTDFLPKGEELVVRLTWGKDEGSGQEFIRVADNGTGMTRTVLEKFFTQIGKSYYRSPDFSREQALLRSRGLFATPISEFGIGILSCFMIGDRIEVRTRPGRTDEHDRQAYDMTVSGPGSLFWMRPGTLDKQGTEVTVFLKGRFKLVDVGEECLEVLRRHFGYKTNNPFFNEGFLQLDGLGDRTPLHPLISAARSVVWPLYPVLASTSGGNDSVRLDDRYHLDVLNPINQAQLLAKAQEWGCPVSMLGHPCWRTFDWVDDQGEDATGSRIRFTFSRHFNSNEEGPADPPENGGLCRQYELAAFVETTLSSGSRSLIVIKGMAVSDTEAVVPFMPVMAAVGSYLWVDLRGKAAPSLTTDRKKALRGGDDREWKRIAGGVFDRWRTRISLLFLAYPTRSIHWQHQLAWRRSGWPEADFRPPQLGYIPVCLSASWDRAQGQELWGVATYHQAISRDLGRHHDRANELARALERAHARSPGREPGQGLEFDCARDLELDPTRACARDEVLAVYLQIAAGLDLMGARELDSIRGRAREAASVHGNDHALASELAWVLARVAAPEYSQDQSVLRSLASVDRLAPDASVQNVAMALPLVTGLASHAEIGACFRDAARLSFFNEAFQPGLERSFPPLGCAGLRGRVGDGQLVAPALLDLAVLDDGRTVAFSDTDGSGPPGIAAYGYDLIFPLTAVPLGRLRRTCARWREHRVFRAMGVLPFMWPGLEGWCKEAATDLKSLFEVPSLLALMPRSELWEKPFAEWTREDWRTCGLTALWDINTGDVLWAKGAHSEAEMRLVGKPIREFVGQLKAGGK